MPIVPGQRVNAANTNNAFLDAQNDDTAVGVIGLANVAAPSGPSITNLQRELNSLASFLGKAINTVKDLLPTWTSNDAGASTDSVTQRAEALSAKFSATTGHVHSGSPGDAPAIAAGSLSGVPKEGIIEAGPTLTAVTGASLIVTTQMAGKTASTGPTVLGVVVNAPYNVVRIGDADLGLEVRNDDSALVYARLTQSAGVWTLSFFVLIAGVETAYTFATAKNLSWFFQEIFNPLASRPTYAVDGLLPQGTGGGAGGAAGGGSAIVWNEDAATAIPRSEYGNRVYAFEQGASQRLTMLIEVPSGYRTGKPISLVLPFYSHETTAQTVQLTTLATLIKPTVTAMDSTTNQRADAATVSIGASTEKIPLPQTFGLTDLTGKINGVSVAPGDLIQLILSRAADTSAEDALIPANAGEIKFK